MSKNHTMEPDYFLLRDDVRRTHLTMVDYINERPPNPTIYDSLKYRYRFDPELKRFSDRYEDLSNEDFNDDEDDDDDCNNDEVYTSHINNRYCGFAHNFLGLSRSRSTEEAEKNAKELVDEEEKHKTKAEKKKQKKIRQKERRRLEKLEKEKENKVKDKPVQVDPGPEKSKQADNDANENTFKGKKSWSAVISECPHPVESKCSSVDDEDEEDELVELDMNSWFVSNAAAIAKRKMDQKGKAEKKAVQTNSRKQHEPDQKSPVPQDEVNNKEETKEEVTANDYITRSVELAVIGNEYASSGNFEMAVKYFTDAIKNNPKEYKLFGNRSFCYEKMFLYVKALTDAEIALSMNPNWVKGLYRKGKALVGLKRYYDARRTYDEVLKLDRTCKDAAEEIMRVQLMQLMEMGFTKEQSSNALIIHGTVERALESLSGLSGLASIPLTKEKEFVSVQRHPHPPAAFSQNRSRAVVPSVAPVQHTPELFPIWVGDLVSSLTEAKLYDLFRTVGHVHNVRVLHMRYCAFVNYTSKADCEKAIQKFHNYAIDGTVLVVRYPDRIHTRLGVSRDASTESAPKNTKQPDECFFWRTHGCIKNERCTYKHIPENKGIDLNKVKASF